MAYKKKPQVDPERSEAASALGGIGGKKGTGEAKRRDPDFYAVTLPEARRRAILKRKLEQP